MHKVMVVDDETDFCFFIKNNLEMTEEFEVTTCTDSTKAMQIARQLRPDVVLIDIMMPGISGEDIAAELAGDRETRDIPYLFLTGIITQQEATADDNVIAGHRFLAKPVEIKKLIPLLREVIRYSKIPE